MLNVTGVMLLLQKGTKGLTSGTDLVPRALPGRCNPLQPARAGALGAGGLGRSAAAWRDDGRAPGSELYQERIPRRHVRVLGRPDAAIPCITSPLKWFSCGVGGSGRQPIQSADPGEGRGVGVKRRKSGRNLHSKVYLKGYITEARNGA